MPASGFNTQTQALSGYAQQVALPDGVVGVFSTLTATTAALTNLTVSGTFTPGTTVNAPVAVTASTLAVTQALYSGKTIVQNAASGCAISLPAATGTGSRYRIYVKTTITSVGVVITTAGSDVFSGGILVTKTSDGTVLASNSTANKTITLNGTTTGGIAGTLVEFQDMASGVWGVTGYATASGSIATPFSN